MAGNARDPLEIFPAEIWEFILKEVRKHGSPQDVLNCSKVCTEFERILEPTKQEWLFGTIFPFIFPYMKGREVLACRRVCKNWRLGVDNFLADSETWRPFNEGTSDISRSAEYDPLQQKKIKWTKIEDEANLESFLEVMGRQEMKTPFFGRSLCLGQSTGLRGREETQFFERALELLSSFGDRIWHLRVVPSLDFDACHFYQILKQMLGYTPNLKSLTFDCSCFVFVQDICRLLDLLEDHPLPEIESLETLEIHCRPTSSLILVKLIATFNFKNLKCFRIHRDSSSYYDHGLHGLMTTHLPSTVMTPLQHLTELHVSGIGCLNLKYIFDNVICPTAPLGKLILDFDGMILGIDFDGVCRLISKWKRTLRMLTIKGYMNSCNGNALLKLDAPNLKRLELEKVFFAPCFLKPSVKASLEYLQIRYTVVPTRGKAKEFYKSVFGAGDLRNLSIWGEMRMLKVLRVQRQHGHPEKVVCTREMYER